jgi:hypothetical protein
MDDTCVAHVPVSSACATSQLRRDELFSACRAETHGAACRAEAHKAKVGYRRGSCERPLSVMASPCEPIQGRIMM